MTRLRSTGRRWSWLIVLLAWMCGAREAEGQRVASGTPSISSELAAALVGNDAFSAPEFLVGTAPPVLSERVPHLPGARILGSMVTRTSAVVVMDVPIRADSVRALLMRELPAAGWRPGPVYGGGSGGFRSPAMRTPGVYCADGRSLSFHLLTRVFGSTTLKLEMREGEQGCPSPRAERVEFVQITRRDPLLVDPPGAAGDCGSRQTFPAGSPHVTAVRSSMPAEALLDYYARQLADSGWTRYAAADSVREVTRTFVSRPQPGQPTSRGTQQVATLRIAIPPDAPECRLVRLDLGTLLER